MNSPHTNEVLRDWKSAAIREERARRDGYGKGFFEGLMIGFAAAGALLLALVIGLDWFGP